MILRLTLHLGLRLRLRLASRPCSRNGPSVLIVGTLPSPRTPNPSPILHEASEGGDSSRARNSDSSSQGRGEGRGKSLAPPGARVLEHRGRIIGGGGGRGCSLLFLIEQGAPGMYHKCKVKQSEATRENLSARTACCIGILDIRGRKSSL